VNDEIADATTCARRPNVLFVICDQLRADDLTRTEPVTP